MGRKPNISAKLHERSNKFIYVLHQKLMTRYRAEYHNIPLTNNKIDILTEVTTSPTCSKHLLIVV